jgi:hypothetical protein
LFRQNHVAHNTHLIGAQPFQVGLAAFPLALAADGGKRADAFVFTLDRGLDVDPAGTATVVAFLGKYDGWLARGHSDTGPPHRPRVVVVVDRASPTRP